MFNLIYRFLIVDTKLSFWRCVNNTCSFKSFEKLSHTPDSLFFLQSFLLTEIVQQRPFCHLDVFFFLFLVTSPSFMQFSILQPFTRNISHRAMIFPLFFQNRFFNLNIWISDWSQTNIRLNWILFDIYIIVFWIKTLQRWLLEEKLYYKVSCCRAYIRHKN